MLAPLGPVYQAGTLSGNPLATAAGLAALDLLDAEVYEVLGRAGPPRRGPGGRDRRGRRPGRTCRSSGRWSASTSATTPAIDYDTAKTTDEALYAALFHALLDQGVALAPGPYEVAFPGLAHTDDVLDEIVARTATALRSI